MSSLYYRDKDEDARRSPVEEFTVLCGRGLWDRPVKARVATARRSKPFLRLLYLVPSSLFLFFACFVLAILLSAGVCFFLLPFTIVFSWRLFFTSISCFLTSFPYVCLYVSLSPCRFLFLALCLSSFPFSLSSVFPSFVLSFCLAFLFPLSFLLSFFLSFRILSLRLAFFLLSFLLSFCLSVLVSFLSFSFRRSFFLSFFLSFCLLLLLSFCRSAVSVFLAFCQSLGIPT